MAIPPAPPFAPSSPPSASPAAASAGAGGGPRPERVHSVLAAGFALLLLLLAAHGPWAPVDERITDVLVRHHAASRAGPPSVLLVEIDQRSLEDPLVLEYLGKWPWPRMAHGEVLDYLGRYAPREVVFDLIFSEPDIHRLDSDAHFIDALRRQPAWLATVRLPDGEASPLAALPAPLGIEPGPDADPGAALPLLAPKALPVELWRAGLINALQDEDGVLRHGGQYHEHQGWRLPYLAARVAQALGASLPETDRVRLNWYGQGFERISYATLFHDSLREQPGLGEMFRDRVVIIGPTAPGLLDLHLTPLGANTPGPWVLATTIANFAAGDFLRRVPTWPTGLLGLGLILGARWTYRRALHPGIGFALFCGLSLLTLAAAWSLLGYGWVWMPYSTLLLVLGYYLSAGLASYLRERRHRDYAIQMFGRFLDPAVVAAVTDPARIADATAGRSGNVTVLFSDIRGFTSLSEVRRAEEVVTLLNRYFDNQVEVLFRHQATLDKFIGDAIMAFWGAPLARADHAAAGVAAALEMSDAVDRFKAELGAEGEQFDIGIGLHSGDAVVGFLGSRRRLDYTVIGDTVNLASRIEGQTKGRARVLVSGATRAECERIAPGRFEFIELGEVTVKGRHEPVRLYQPTWGKT